MRSSSPPRCFSPRSSTQTGRGEPLHRRASRPLRCRADLPDPGRVGVRLLRAPPWSTLSTIPRGRAAARGDQRDAQAQLRGLRLPADLEGAAASGRERTPLPGAAVDGHQRDPRAKRRGKPWRTTTPDPLARRRADLVQRDFSAERPNSLWVADFSYLRCWEGLSFFAFIIDAFSRMVVGWQLAANMRTTLVLDALRMALGLREPGADVALVHHSDLGSQLGLNRSLQQ